MRVPVLVSNEEDAYILLYTDTNTCRVAYYTTGDDMFCNEFYGGPEEGETILLPAELAL